MEVVDAILLLLVDHPIYDGYLSVHYITTRYYAIIKSHTVGLVWSLNQVVCSYIVVLCADEGELVEDV